MRSFGGFSLASRPHSCACSLPASRPRSASESSVAGVGVPDAGLGERGVAGDRVVADQRRDLVGDLVRGAHARTVATRDQVPITGSRLSVEVSQARDQVADHRLRPAGRRAAGARSRCIAIVTDRSRTAVREPGSRSARASRAVGPGDAQVHGADRLVRRPAARTGDPGDADADVGAEPGAGALGQGDGHLGADRPVLGEQLGRDVEQLLLGRVRVGGDPAEHVGRRPGALGQPGGEQPAGAGLGGGDGQAPVGERGADEVVERRARWRRACRPCRAASTATQPVVGGLGVRARSG